MSNTNNPSGADVLAMLRKEIECAGFLGPKASEARAKRLSKVETTVATLIARNAELEAENKALRKAVAMFRAAKAWVASDSWDGIDRRGRELMEEADAASITALARTSAKGDAS